MALTSKQIIALVQAGHNVATEENIFIPMTNDQWQARHASFISGLKMNMFKVGARLRLKGM